MTVGDTRTSPLRSTTAAEAMRPGVITVPSQTTVRDLAHTMSLRGIHAVLVTRAAEAAPTSAAVVRDLDVVRAALEGDTAKTTAGELVGGSLAFVERQASLHEVADAMVDAGYDHVLVAETEPYPAGVLSAFDLVAVIGDHDPRFARAVRPGPARPALSEPRLDRVPVKAAMHPGVVACPASTPITAVAGLLADHRVHCTAVSGVKVRGANAEQLIWALVDAMDVVDAARRWDPACTAGDLAGAQPVTVGEDETMASAAHTMVERGATHVVAVDRNGLPSGVVSTLDVAAICAIA
jgi:CBS domain-containing protein